MKIDKDKLVIGDIVHVKTTAPYISYDGLCEIIEFGHDGPIVKALDPKYTEFIGELGISFDDIVGVIETL